jgi:hypothetical protein
MRDRITYLGEAVRPDLRRESLCASLAKLGKDMNNHTNGSDKLLASQLMKYRGEFCLLSVVTLPGSGELKSAPSFIVTGSSG